MNRATVAALCILSMIAAIVGLDVMFLEDRFWARLLVNISVVAVAAAVYLRFIKRR